MKKIMIIGCPGAGKSTFARKLSARLGIPLYYLDMIWHKSDRTNVTPEEFDRRLNTILAEPQWIIDGNYLRTMEMRLQSCDTCFFLDFPLDVCLKGAESRVGKPREDMPWQEKEFDSEFRQFILDFQAAQLGKIQELMEKYRESKSIIVFTSREEENKYLEEMAECSEI